jgi:hypothetical protein
MSSYTEHDDAAWLDGNPASVPERADTDYTGHPQLHALEHATEQLRAARHWSHVDPDVEAAYRAAVDALAQELHHHAENQNRHETKESTAMYETPITVIGNLTADPELRFTPSGAAVASFTVASTPRAFDRQANEWKDGETLFLRGQVWRESAENVAESLIIGGSAFTGAVCWGSSVMDMSMTSGSVGSGAGVKKRRGHTNGRRPVHLQIFWRSEV